MTQQVETPAVGGEAAPAESATTAEQYFEQLAAEEFGITDEEEDAPAEGEQPETESAEGADDEQGNEEEAEELPPIAAPVSWDAESKETFKSLPREAQEIVAKREAERERFVQSKSQEAARAKQEAEQSAQAQLVQYDAQMAQQYQQLAAQLAPQPPDPSMLRINPEAFYAAEAEFRTKTAQQQQLQQQAQMLAHQAQQRQAQIAQATQVEDHRILTEHFPEWHDPSSGPELRRQLTAVAKELGYSDDLIVQASATDIMAIRKVAEIKAKADKYDALQKTKMANVRAAKGLPKVAKPGVSQGPGQIRAAVAANAIAALRETGSQDAAAAAFKAIGF